MSAKTATAVTIGCLLVVLLLGYVYLWREQDEQLINRNLARVIELVEKSGEETIFVTISQSREIVSYIASSPEIYLGPPLPALTDRKELEGLIMQIRQNLHALSVHVADRSVTVAADGKSAEMKLEAVATVTYSGESGRESRKFSIGWVKEEGEWVIQKVRLLEGVPLNDFVPEEMPL